MTKKEDFFVNGIPKDMACISPQPIHRNVIHNIELNNLKIINDYFTVNDIKKNICNWINPITNRQYALRTLLFLHFKSIIGIYEPHIPSSYLKSKCLEIWDKEYMELDNTSRHKFRSVEDVNVWLFRSWQLLEGLFVPRLYKFGKLLSASQLLEIHSAIVKRQYKIICINDDDTVEDFEKTKRIINKELDNILPEKSSFELDKGK